MRVNGLVHQFHNPILPLISLRERPFHVSKGFELSLQVGFYPVKYADVADGRNRLIHIFQSTSEGQHLRWNFRRTVSRFAALRGGGDVTRGALLILLCHNFLTFLVRTLKVLFSGAVCVLDTHLLGQQ